MKHALKLECGIVANHKRVHRLMRESGNLSSVKPKKKRYFKGNSGVVPNLLKGKNFATTRPYEKFVADVTEFKYRGGKIYLSAIKDVDTRMIEAYHISRTQSEVLILTTLEKLKNNFLPGKIIFHSDQGQIYRSFEVQKFLKENYFFQSMSKSGTPTDNAPMESFFGTLKSETIYNVRFECDDLIVAIENYIFYYNNYRIQKSLGYLTPIQFKKLRLAGEKENFTKRNFDECGFGLGKRSFETENFNDAMHH